MSRPLKVTWRAVFFSSARASTSFSGTPTQRALPIAPLASCPPVTRGVNSARLLPEHWLTATTSTGLNSFQLRHRQLERLAHGVAADLG